MTDRRRVLAFAIVVIVAAVGALAPTASADPGSVGVSQGGTCQTVTAYGDGTQTVSDFYDYRSGSGTEFSSYGTQDLQRSQESQIFLYNGSQGLSLVFLHDEFGDEQEGGTISMDVAGLPDDGEWAVKDDLYDNDTQDDNWQTGQEPNHIDWMWGPNRSDGGAFRGLDGDYEITIDPAFNEEADHYDDWAWGHDEVDRWFLRTSTDDTVALSMTDSVTVTPACGGSAPNAALSAPAEAEAGSEVTLDASDSSDDNGIVAYHWDVDGDGTNETTTSDPTYAHAYEETGNYTATVTTVDDAGQGDSATATIEVGDTTPPTTRIDAPSSAQTGESVPISGEDSSDNGQIASYDWAFGDGTTGSGASVQHAYDSAGTYTVELTVTDESGNQATETTQIEVSDGGADPVARIDAPSSAETGESVTISGENSSDDGTIQSYDWDLGDGSSATGSTPSHSYESAGTYTITLTVTDDGGNQDTTTTDITVESTNDGSGGGSDGGGSTGGGDSSESTQSLTRPSADVVEFRAADVPADETIAFDLPSDLGGDAVRFERVRIGHDGRVDDLQLRLREAGDDRTVPGADVSPAALVREDASGTAAATDVTVTFSLPETAFENGTDPSAVSLYAKTDGTWTELPTETVSGGSDGRVRLRATAPGVQTVAVGVSAPVIEVEEVSVPRQTAVGEEQTVRVTYRNDGSHDGTVDTVLQADGSTIGTVSTAVPSGESRTAQLSVTFAETGTRTLTVAGTEQRVDVIPPAADVSVQNVTMAEEVPAGEEFEIVARVANDGPVAANYTARLELFGEVVGHKTVRLGPGETRAVTFTRSVTSPGNYTATVGEGSRAFTVSGEAGDEASTPISTVGQPGFDLVTGLAAALVSVGVLRRRRR